MMCESGNGFNVLPNRTQLPGHSLAARVNIAAPFCDSVVRALPIILGTKAMAQRS